MRSCAQQEKLEKIASFPPTRPSKSFSPRSKNSTKRYRGRMRKLEISSNEKLEQRAKEILTTAVHRLGNSVVSDVLATTVTLPNDEIKGKIIGKEGRNIRSFERATGVDVIVDDTPGTITLSSYDPIRRQIARIALENLILDGRIQPAKIEEAVQKAEQRSTTSSKRRAPKPRMKPRSPISIRSSS
jgi:ribonuclease Y